MRPWSPSIRRRIAFGIVWKAIADGLKLRHENRSWFISRAFQAELRFLRMNSRPFFILAQGATVASNASGTPSRNSAFGPIPTPTQMTSTMPSRNSVTDRTITGASSSTNSDGQPGFDRTSLAKAPLHEYTQSTAQEIPGDTIWLGSLCLV